MKRYMLRDMYSRIPIEKLMSERFYHIGNGVTFFKKRKMEKSEW